ncbi:MAG: Rieske 2Fe-2S domain-containing protein [Gemmataceae bacterium]|nr:Rieske 2Fe-2S domain-containing protein [Gemmataceae bacterium]
MERRTFLRWAVHGMGAVFGAVLGIPALIYLIDPRNRPTRERGYRSVARYKDLVPGVPTEVVIRESVQDAWTVHPDVVVGRVWLVRRSTGAESPRVEAFTAQCPHLGCSINYTGTQFLCPCHGGRFTLQGQRVDPTNNPAPRDMDNLKDPASPEPNPKLERIPGTPDGDPDFNILVQFRKFKTNQPEKEDLA